MRTVFHKCTWGGLARLIDEEYLKEMLEEPLCCSSLDSYKLFWRNVCVELEIPEEAILIERTDDIDARTQTEHDEVRIIFKPEYIKRVIADKRFMVTWQDVKCCADAGVLNPFTGYQESLSNFRQVLKDHLVKKNVNVISAKESGYSKKFLNI